MLRHTLALCLLAVLLLQAAQTKLTPYDEPLWYRRAQRPIWSTSSEYDYIRAVDVPGGCRLIYWAALKATNQMGKPYLMPDYEIPFGTRETMEGRTAPGDAVLIMRGCNVIGYMLGLLCLYKVALWGLKRPLLAALAVSPLVVSPLFPVQIVPRVGPDAFLMGGLSACLFTWVLGERRGKLFSLKWSVLMGLVFGATIICKVNGAFALFAYMAYAACYGRGRERVTAGVVAFIVAGTCFYFFNIAFIGRWPHAVMFDIINRRLVVAAFLDTKYGVLGWTEVWNHSVALWPIIPVALYACWSARKNAVLRPILWWGCFLFLGTLFSTNWKIPRYLGPVELGLYFPVALAMLLGIQRRCEETRNVVAETAAVA